MILYKKLVGFAIFLAVLVIVTLTTWYFWPSKIEIQTDLSENADNEKNIGSIQGSATNSQNNNQRHINFSGDFVFTLLIFILLLVQSIFQSFIFFRSMRMNTGNKKTQDQTSSSTPPSPQLPMHTQHRSQSLPQTPQSQLLTPYTASPQTPPNAYYTISETPQGPYGPIQKQISEIDLRDGYFKIEKQPEPQAQTDPDYKKLYTNLKIRSSAAGLDV